MKSQDIVSSSAFQITSADVDMFSRIKLGSLVNFLIQSAAKSADDLGLGFSNLKEYQLFWVLSRLTVEIYSPLTWYHSITVNTWPKNIERIFYVRDFVVKNEKGEIVAKATSAWLALDMESKRPKVIDSKKTEVFHLLSHEHALSYSPEKINQKALKQSIIKEPSYFDIDLNKHLTSTRYVDWMMDTFPVEFHKVNYPKKLSINYLKETMLGQRVSINKENTANEFLFEGVLSENDKPTFRAKINI